MIVLYTNMASNLVSEHQEYRLILHQHFLIRYRKTTTDPWKEKDAIVLVMFAVTCTPINISLSAWLNSTCYHPLTSPGHTPRNLPFFLTNLVVCSPLNYRHSERDNSSRPGLLVDQIDVTTLISVQYQNRRGLLVTLG